MASSKNMAKMMSGFTLKQAKGINDLRRAGIRTEEERQRSEAELKALKEQVEKQQAELNKQREIIEQNKDKSSASSLSILEIATRPQVREKIEQDGLESLVDTIRENGVMNPITVVRTPSEEKPYLVIAGHRRLGAVKTLYERFEAEDIAAHDGKRSDEFNPWARIPAVVMEIDPKDVPYMQLTENVAREDLKPHEIGQAIKALLDDYTDNVWSKYTDEEKKLHKDDRLTQTKIGIKIGMSKSKVSKYVAVASAPPNIMNLSIEGKVRDVEVLNLLIQLYGINHERASQLIERGEFSRALIKREINGQEKTEENIKETNKESSVQGNIFEQNQMMKPEAGSSEMTPLMKKLQGIDEPKSEEPADEEVSSDDFEEEDGDVTPSGLRDKGDFYTITAPPFESPTAKDGDESAAEDRQHVQTSPREYPVKSLKDPVYRIIRVKVQKPNEAPWYGELDYDQNSSVNKADGLTGVYVIRESDKSEVFVCVKHIEIDQIMEKGAGDFYGQNYEKAAENSDSAGSGDAV